jgi:hypothetical protein
VCKSSERTKKTQIPDGEEKRDTDELNGPQGSQYLGNALVEGDVYVLEKDATD